MAILTGRIDYDSENLVKELCMEALSTLSNRLQKDLLVMDFDGERVADRRRIITGGN